MTSLISGGFCGAIIGRGSTEVEITDNDGNFVYISHTSLVYIFIQL